MTLLREPFLGRELSDREVEVFALVVGGSTNAEIGKRLILSQHTVNSHMRHVIAKLGATNRAHAIGLLLFAHHPDIVRRIAAIVAGEESSAPVPPEPEIGIALGQAVLAAKSASMPPVAPARGRGL